MKNIFLPLCLLLLLAACSGKTFPEMQFHSPGNDRHVTVSGEQKIVMDPIKVKVVVKVAKVEKPFFIELAASSLDASTVSMTWESNDKGTLVFTQSDGSVKVMNMNLSDEQIHVVQDIPGEKPYIPLIKP